MTTYSIGRRDPMALADINSWCDLLTDPPPSAMLAGRSVCTNLMEHIDVGDSDFAIWVMDVFAIDDDEVEWVPGLGKTKMLLGSRKDIVAVLKWIGFLRTLPTWKRDAFIAIEKHMHNKASEETK